MSLEFSQELDTPSISPSYAPQDAGEIGLRPKLLGAYPGQEKAKGNLAIYIAAPRRRPRSDWSGHRHGTCRDSGGRRHAVVSVAAQ